MGRREIDWDSITITDDYMFITVFSDPALCRELIERVLGVPVEHVEIVRGERALVPEMGAHGIRMDVYVADGAGTVYDVEMQNARAGDLARRSRYYLSANDMDCIGRGESYEDMSRSFVIFICGFDPFGRGLVRYTVVPRCREDGVEMDDGAARVFVNAPAHASCADAPLARALAYLCGGKIGDEFTRRLDDAVRLERARPEWRRERMRLDMLLRDKFVEGRKEGIALGREEQVVESAQSLMRGLDIGVARALELLGVSEQERPHYQELIEAGAAE